uniref:Uncharacterized protein n=1 Tax=Paramoeba aestuarina TaxID=180227 RepID=A0A7S4JWW5_9EUKA|mmetsp:Transcript_13732/g.21314  ORF Transcript_13732/g.21314 Transcript_13732/m.21314 type:complete len:174 (+) Transcript_13732:3-524(+)
MAKSHPKRMKVSSASSAHAASHQHYVEEKELLGQATKEYLKNTSGDARREDDIKIVRIPDKGPRFDCESMLSTLSNAHNRPSVIVSASTKNTLSSQRRSKASAESPYVDGPREIPIRHPQESKEEKKERRKLVKIIQAENRSRKKRLSEAFKAERIKQNNARCSSGRRQISFS